MLGSFFAFTVQNFVQQPFCNWTKFNDENIQVVVYIASKSVLDLLKPVSEQSLVMRTFINVVLSIQSFAQVGAYGQTYIGIDRQIDRYVGKLANFTMPHLVIYTCYPFKT